MDLRQTPRYPLHTKALIASPDKTVQTCKAENVSTFGVCIALDRQIPLSVPYQVRFVIKNRDESHTITARVKATYGALGSDGKFRVGFSFLDENPERTKLINTLTDNLFISGVQR